MPFISSRLDDCNRIFTALPQKSIRQLRFIQNAAARVLAQTREVIMLLQFSDLYTGLLSVKEYILGKRHLLVYKALNDLGSKL